jgi:hypothetical protein
MAVPYTPPQLGAPNAGVGLQPASTGGNQQPGFFGNGAFQPTAYQINPNAFLNPAGNQGQNLSSELGNYAAGNVGAPITAATSAPVNQGVYNQGIGGQLGLAQQYQQMAAGGGPSLATITAQQQGAANLAQANSMLGSARGAGSPAAAQLAARNAAMTGQQQVAGNAVAGRTQEELAAMNAAGGLYGNVAGQGLQGTGQVLQNQQFNAGQSNLIGQGNQQANLGANQAYLGSLQAQDLAQLQAQQNQQQLGVQNQNNLNTVGQAAYANAAGHSIGGQLVSGLQSAAGTAAGIALHSDKRLKKDIKSLSKNQTNKLWKEVMPSLFSLPMVG